MVDLYGKLVGKLVGGYEPTQLKNMLVKFSSFPQWSGVKITQYLSWNPPPTSRLSYTSYNTPPKTNMEPENEALEEEISIKNHHFQVPC